MGSVIPLGYGCAPHYANCGAKGEDYL